MRFPFLLAALAVGLAGCDALTSTDAAASGAIASGDTTEGPISSAHESNSRFELTGMQGGDAITGVGIINYAAGAPNEWRSTVNVRGLDAGTYDVYTLLNGGNETLVCSFTIVDATSRQGCSADTDLPGFNTLQVREADGDVVASGMAIRRGGNRA